MTLESLKLCNDKQLFTIFWWSSFINITNDILERRWYFKSQSVQKLVYIDLFFCLISKKVLVILM